MNLYYFFKPDRETGNPTYGHRYFLMAKDLKSAKQALRNSKEYQNKEKYSLPIDKMGVWVRGENEVVYTEAS